MTDLDTFNFLCGCRDAIQAMRDAKMGEGIIGLVVNEIRSAAINSEFRRLQELTRLNPPKHMTWVEMGDAIRDK
jgi:hypothetical protein